MATCRPASGSGLLTGQSLPAARVAPARCRSPNGYCQAARSGPRKGMVSSSICGSWAAHSGWMLATAPSRAKRVRSSGWTTWRWARWCRAPRHPLAARAASTASSASRTARSPSAWKCTWKPSASSSVTCPRSATGSTKLRPELAVAQPQPSRYGLVIAAVKFSAMPSCMIFTEPARNRPWPNSSRRCTSSGICSAPRSRCHQSAPVTRAVSVPERAAAR